MRAIQPERIQIKYSALIVPAPPGAGTQPARTSLWIPACAGMTRRFAFRETALALAVSALAFLMGCSGVKVHSAANPNAVAAAEFASISTYDWVSSAMGDGDDVHLAQQIESAVDANLAAKGLRRVSGAVAESGSGGAVSPDMLVAQYTRVELKWIRHD